ncbi:hypothetical protein NL351_27660, partial [Klebsiella pneumoniae]|nr:hypothetical protein [Klebsiella pneumoniae]
APSPAYGAEIVYRVGGAAGGPAIAAALRPSDASNGDGSRTAGAAGTPGAATALLPDESPTAARAGTPPPPSAEVAAAALQGGTSGNTAGGM